MRSEGKNDLNALAEKLKEMVLEAVLITGYTDRIGSDDYNRRLSASRAETIRNYLVSQGIDAKHIHTEGNGEKDPVTGDRCNGISSRKALIECYQPDRRVEIEIFGSVPNVKPTSELDGLILKP